MSWLYSRSRVAQLATVFVLLGGAMLTGAGFLPWTSRGLGSTQSLLELSDLAGSELIDDRWISPILLVPPLVGTIAVALAGIVLASRDLLADPRRLRVMTAAMLTVDLIAVAVSAAIVHGLHSRPLHVPGAGFILATAAMTVIALAAGALLRQSRAAGAMAHAAVSSGAAGSLRPEGEAR